MDSSLFGHPALRFATSSETLATEALVYILNRSDAARHACTRVPAGDGGDAAPALRYRSQAYGSDQGVPDIVGKAAEGQTLSRSATRSRAVSTAILALERRRTEHPAR